MNEPRLTVQTDRVQLKDSSGAEVGTADNRLETESRDTDTFTIFSNMLTEMKITNLYLSIMTDMKIEKSDIN